MPRDKCRTHDLISGEKRGEGDLERWFCQEPSACFSNSTKRPEV